MESFISSISLFLVAFAYHFMKTGVESTHIPLNFQQIKPESVHLRSENEPSTEDPWESGGWAIGKLRNWAQWKLLIDWLV